MPWGFLLAVLGLHIHISHKEQNNSVQDMP